MSVVSLSASAQEERCLRGPLTCLVDALCMLLIEVGGVHGRLMNFTVQGVLFVVFVVVAARLYPTLIE